MLKLKKDLQKQLNEVDELILNNTNAVEKLERQPQSEKANNSMENVNQERRVKLISKSKNFYSKLKMHQNISFNHVFNFYNLFGINQNAIKNQDYEESYLKTKFYLYNIEKVQTRKNAIIIQLSPETISPVCPPQYLVDRFKSFGDQKFYRIACKLEEITQSLAKMKKQDIVPLEPEGNQQLYKFLEIMQDKMYVCNLPDHRMLISRSLIEFLGYNFEIFAVQAVKYHTLMNQFYSSKMYEQVLLKMIDRFKWLSLLLSNKISKGLFEELTSFQYNDYLHTKDGKQIYCKMELNFNYYLTGGVEIKQVLSDSRQHFESSELIAEQNMKAKRECQNIRKKEAELLTHLIELPLNVMPQNQDKVANYKEIKFQNQREGSKESEENIQMNDQ